MPGLIPAHAGKTSPTLFPWPCSWAHPRSRGENVSHAVPLALFLGSSPLTRGKLAPGESEAHPVRLIPAHAGKTGRHLSHPHTAGAHPRSRGENDRVFVDGNGELGSSPLTRGKLDETLDEALTGGLIPAHAGKT